MKIEKLKVKNFRGYTDETEILLSDLTALIGRNDAGKSTLLEALEIFFNNKVVSCEKEDLSIVSDSDTIEISCIFSDFPENLTVDSGSQTTLSQENLLNEEGLLEIKKKFKCGSGKPKSTTFIVCNHPINDEISDLLQLKQTELKKRIRTLGIEDSKYDARNNSSMRQAILKSIPNHQKQLVEVPADKNETKGIYTALEKYLPIFALFQSDRNSQDSDKEITDPMSVAVANALRSLDDEIETIKNEVRIKAIETASRTLEKLKEMSPDLADSLIPEFKSEPNFNSVFKLSIKSDNDISINKRGSGVRRLILLNFFRAEAERKLSEDEKNSSIIYAFEEPETSQHPSHQRMLVESFIDLSNKENTQLLLTTHTPALAELLPVESLRLIDNVDGNAVIREGDSIYEQIADMLGVVSDTIPNWAKGILFVEGTSDIVFFDHLCKMLKESGEIEQTMEDKGIAILPVGGCGTLKSWISMRLVDRFELPWAIFLDSDKEYESHVTDNQNFIGESQENGIKAYCTRKREAENYLHSSIFDRLVIIEDYNDVKKTVNSVYTSVGKKKVLTKYWPMMTFDMLREKETYEVDGAECYELTQIVKDILTLV